LTPVDQEVDVIRHEAVRNNRHVEFGGRWQNLLEHCIDHLGDSEKGLTLGRAEREEITLKSDVQPRIESRSRGESAARATFDR
jgi:hypothetical protein